MRANVAFIILTGLLISAPAAAQDSDLSCLVGLRVGLTLAVCLFACHIDGFCIDCLLINGGFLSPLLYSVRCSWDNELLGQCQAIQQDQ